MVGTDPGTAHVYAFQKTAGGVLWRYPSDAGVATDLVRAGGAALAVSLDDALICLDLATGTERWRVPPTSHPLEIRSMGSTPAVAGARTFYGDLDGVVRGVHVPSGRTLWTRELGSQIVTATALVRDEVVVGTLDGRIVSLSPEDGAVGRTTHVEPRARGHFVTADSTTCVFLSESDWSGVLVGLDPSLALRWSASPPDGERFVSARPFRYGDHVLAGTSDGRIVAIRPEDGRRAWTYAVDTGRSWENDGVRVIGAAGDTLYVGTISGMLYALAPE